MSAKNSMGILKEDILHVRLKMKRAIQNIKNKFHPIILVENFYT
jgi:hypothetical protein